jgi:hypothetical protein
MNIIEPRNEPDPENESAAFFHDRARASGFTNLFDWFLSRRDTDHLEVLLICCQNYVIELINEINETLRRPVARPNSSEITRGRSVSIN